MIEIKQNKHKNKEAKKNIKDVDIDKDRKSTLQKKLIALISGKSTLSFAKKCGLSEGAIRSYLSGVSEPTISKLILIAKANNVTLDWLTSEDVIDKVNKNQDNETSKRSNCELKNEWNKVFDRLTINERNELLNYTARYGINSLLQLINQQQNKITQHTTQKDALQTQQDAIDTMLAAFPEASRFTVNAWMNFLKLNESDQREIWEQHTKAKRGDTINNTQKES